MKLYTITKDATIVCNDYTSIYAIYVQIMLYYENIIRKLDT